MIKVLTYKINGKSHIKKEKSETGRFLDHLVVYPYHSRESGKSQYVADLDEIIKSLNQLNISYQITFITELQDEMERKSKKCITCGKRVEKLYKQKPGHSSKIKPYHACEKCIPAYQFKAEWVEEK